MYRTCFIIVLVFCAISNMYAQAEITFNSLTYDYDTILQGTNGICRFTFTNTGNQPLIISRTTTSCGCTAAQHSSKPVMPGRQGHITVTYNTERVGPFRKTVVVHSNAMSTPNTVLRIKGYVKPKRQ